METVFSLIELYILGALYETDIEKYCFHIHRGLECYSCSLPHYLTCNLTQSKQFPINSKVAKLTICFQRKLFAFHKQRNQFSGCFYIMTARLVRKWKIQTINQLFHIQNTKHLVLLTFFSLTWLKQQGWLCCANIALEKEN